ncbi:MAG: preprotein translocase subunit SecA [Candidatus Omnitrophota bacterium]
MIKRFVLKSCQKKINSLKPGVNIQLSSEIPTPSLRESASLASLVSEVNAKEEELAKCPDGFFKEKTFEFKRLIREKAKNVPPDRYKETVGGVLDQILPSYFAMVREAARRTVKMRHFDVQILGGIILHKNKIAEMVTGEGKTLVATLAASLNALTEGGVHIVTVNDYLAKRDREWMGPIYQFLGLSCGVIQQDLQKLERKAAYLCDITYGTNNEFGFDYLRDNMVTNLDSMVQRGHFYAIVDEVDSILVDEARTPLIISGSAESNIKKYYDADKVIRQLKARVIIQSFYNKNDGTITLKNTDGSEVKLSSEELEQSFDAICEEKTNNVDFTSRGEKRAEKLLGLSSISEEAPDRRSNSWKHYLSQSLKAHNFFRRDKEYIVKDGKVVIVDDFTGRLMPGRRWSDGLHQAVEAKEGLKIQQESQTLATITLQNYFRMYDKLSGMTGTAYTEASEFNHIYKLDVSVVSTNCTLIRKNHPDRIYKNKQGKFNAVISEIEELYRIKRPVLVGTTSIEDSEELSFLLQKKGIDHNILNAKYHEKEAYIIAQAGRLGQVTIATNMAGRGTDIVLGGNIDYFVKNILARNNILPDDAAYNQEYQRLYREHKDRFQAEHDAVIKLEGLHIIGTQRHEARRIDNQLRGRSGRQGDPGSSRFYISLEDDLMRLFGSERIYGLMETFGFPEDQPIEHGIINHSLAVAQKKVEAHNFEIRKQLLQYDNIMNKQREVIYSQRKEILEGKDIKEEILSMLDEIIERNLPLYFQEENDSLGLVHWIKSKFDLELTIGQLSNLDPERTIDLVKEKLRGVYQEKESKSGPEDMRQMEKAVSLWIVDSRWKEHLLIIDHLREGIHLRAHAHVDPLVEYQRESYLAFQDMITSIKEGIVELAFKAKLTTKEDTGVFTETAKNFIHTRYAPLDKGKEQLKAAREVPRSPKTKKVGRNEPCPCGSGKKYKKCCGK